MAGGIRIPLGTEVGLGPGDIVRWGHGSPLKGTQPPMFGGCLLRRNGWAGWIKMPLGTKVGLGPCHIVLDGDPPLPSPKGAQQPPLFGPCLLWPRSPSAIAELLSPGDIVRWGHSSPRKGKQPPPMFGPCLLRRNGWAGWIKMPFGTRVGLGPGHIVLDGDPDSPPQNGAQPQIFGPCLLWPNGWMDRDATWYGSRPRPRPHCARR